MWLRCVSAGFAFMRSSAAQKADRRRLTDPTNIRFGEQSALVFLCSASANATWRHETGCLMRCAGFHFHLYSTGCSPAWAQ